MHSVQEQRWDRPEIANGDVREHSGDMSTLDNASFRQSVSEAGRLFLIEAGVLIATASAIGVVVSLIAPNT